MTKRNKDNRPFQTNFGDTGPLLDHWTTGDGKPMVTVNTGEPLRLGRGHPTEIEWQGAYRHVIIKVSQLGLPQGHGAKAKVGRWMTDWFDERNVYPGETMIKDHVRLIYEELEKDGYSDE